jgi:hypothetical protein
MKRLLLGLVSALAISTAQAVDFVVVGQANGDGSVTICNAFTGAVIDTFQAYGPSYTGGVYVAAGDVTGDGVADIITGAGAGGGPHVKVFDGKNHAEIRSFFAYPQTFAGGVRVAAGDVNGDGFDDIITGTGAGSAGHVKVFSGATNGVLASFFAFPSYTGGVYVGVAENGFMGHPEIVVGSNSTVSRFIASGSPLSSFFAYGSGFSGGVRVATGDVTGDGVADIITGVATGAPPHVKAFSGVDNSLFHSFFAFGAAFSGGVSIASGDGTGDGVPDMYVGTASLDGVICSFNGTNGTFVGAFEPFGAAFTGGLDLGFGREVAGNPLYIHSQNPSGGVPMTVWTTDLNGNKNGNTAMSRLYGASTNASVTAPLQFGNQWFDRWERDGANAGTNRTLTTVMGAGHTIRAIYLAGRTLTVDSQNPASGVPITVWTPDKNGQKSGNTTFTRTYTEGTTVSLTAPALVGSNYFVRWNLAGSPWQAAKTVSLLMGGGNRLLTAVFATGYLLTVLSNQANVLIKSWTPDKAGRGDGTTQFTRVYAPNASVSFTAPPSINALPFKRWIVDGSPQADFKRTVTIIMVTPRIIEAVYE